MTTPRPHAELAARQSVADELRLAARNAALAGINGWGNLCSDAADTIDNLRTRLAEVEKQRDYAIHQAQIWKLEAASQKATVAECYQICTDATGEPGDWNGAEPVRALKAQLVEAQKDEERLDWLEDNWHRPVLEDWEDRFETLRAAIDAVKGRA